MEEEFVTVLPGVSSRDSTNRSHRRESKSSSPMGGIVVMALFGGELTRVSSTIKKLLEDLKQEKFSLVG